MGRGHGAQELQPGHGDRADLFGVPRVARDLGAEHGEQPPQPGFGHNESRGVRAENSRSLIVVECVPFDLHHQEIAIA